MLISVPITPLIPDLEPGEKFRGTFNKDFTPAVVKYMKEWYRAKCNGDYSCLPRVTDEEKQAIADVTGLRFSQVTNWLYSRARDVKTNRLESYLTI